MPYTKSTTVTDTIRSLTTGSVFAASGFRLFARSGKHVDDEVWGDGRIPAVDSNGSRPYSMTEFEPSDLAHGYTVYLFDPDGNCEEGSGAYEPVEFVIEDEDDTIDVLNEHLARCGAQEDSSAIVARAEEDGTVTVTDGQGNWTGTPADALARLAALPDGCGWEAL
jgi:hypothetical protein